MVGRSVRCRPNGGPGSEVLLSEVPPEWFRMVPSEVPPEWFRRSVRCRPASEVPPEWWAVRCVPPQ